MKKIALLLLLVSFALPVALYAQTDPGGGRAATGTDSGGRTPPATDSGGGRGTDSGGGRIDTPTVTARATLENPLAGVNSISDLFYKLANALISISYVVIAFFLILSGFKFVKAQGSEKEIEEAKKTFYYTIIGALLIIGARTIIAIVQGIIRGLNT
jgi:hypothetical protein